MTTINMQDPDQRQFFIAAQLKGQLKILAAGMTIRGLPRSAALQRASQITGKPYKNSRLIEAIEDLQKVVDAKIAAAGQTA